MIIRKEDFCLQKSSLLCTRTGEYLIKNRTKYSGILLTENFNYLTFILRTNIAFVRTNAVGQKSKPTTTEKRRFVYYNESSLSFGL